MTRFTALLQLLRQGSRALLATPSSLLSRITAARPRKQNLLS
jgi:hypothetical protein